MDKNFMRSYIEKFEIVEFEPRYAEAFKELLVVLQAHIASLDSEAVIVLKSNYKEDYYIYIQNEIIKHDGKIFLALCNSEVVGTVVCKIFQGGDEENITTSCPKIGFISDLVVAKNYRGHGVAAKLLQCAEDYFKYKQCKYMRLEVFEPNILAQSLYYDYGFTTLSRYLSKKL